MVVLWWCFGALGSFGFQCSQHTPTPRPSVERSAEEKYLLSDRVKLPSAEARIKGMKGGPVGVGEGIPTGFHSH